MPRFILALGVLSFTIALSLPAVAQHEGDIIVGRSGADQLRTTGFPVSLKLIYLPPTDGILKGWADNNPGFDRVIQEDPENDLYPMHEGADVDLAIEQIDPALRFLDNGFNIYDEPGEACPLGDENLHVHVIWHINSLDPDFDPDPCVWDATFTLHDQAGRHADSDAFIMSFTNVELREADGDFEPDGDVDLADHRALAVCLSGPSARPAPDDPDVTTCETECVNAFDFDGDRDADLRDAAEMQNAFGG